MDGEGERRTWANAPIRVFTPLTPGDVCIALIGSGTVMFTGKTPMSVRRAAETWRAEELAKMDARAAASEKRKAALRAAREARRELRADADEQVPE